MVNNSQQQKENAASFAAKYVQSGMIVGLGSGATATLFLERLAERLNNGDISAIIGVPTSTVIEARARELNIPLSTLEEYPAVDLTVDGADEVDPQLNLIKGGGGALLREKIIAQASKREIIIVDEGKLSAQLGTKWHVPIEVVTFGWRTQFEWLTQLGASVVMRERQEGLPFITDQGNYILDAKFGQIADPVALAKKLTHRVGIVEHGLFVNIASEVIVGMNEGVRILTPQVA